MSVPADKVVVTAGTITLLSTTAHHILPGNMGGLGELPPTRLLFGTALAFMGISMLADPAPDVAKGLSLIIMYTALAQYGIPMLTTYLDSNLPTQEKKK